MSTGTLDGFNENVELVAVTFEVFLVQLRRDRVSGLLGCRLWTVDEDEAINITSSASVPLCDTAKENESVNRRQLVGYPSYEFPNWCMKLALWDLNYWIIRLGESAAIDAYELFPPGVLNLDEANRFERISGHRNASMRVICCPAQISNSEC
jgi:hypothetical protein